MIGIELVEFLKHYPTKKIVIIQNEEVQVKEKFSFNTFKEVELHKTHISYDPVLDAVIIDTYV